MVGTSVPGGNPGYSNQAAVAELNASPFDIYSGMISTARKYEGEDSFKALGIYALAYEYLVGNQPMINIDAHNLTSLNDADRLPSTVDLKSKIRTLETIVGVDKKAGILVLKAAELAYRHMED